MDCVVVVFSTFVPVLVFILILIDGLLLLFLCTSFLPLFILFGIFYTLCSLPYYLFCLFFIFCPTFCAVFNVFRFSRCRLLVPVPLFGSSDSSWGCRLGGSTVACEDDLYIMVVSYHTKYYITAVGHT